ncbi:MAG: hypothetical protein JNJ54_35885 [Myxococcaceae bacterium]|nr:hypothetical protein [Myxococcaceae bacterium]
MARLLALAWCFGSGLAWAHPEGFHARYVFTVERTQLTALLVLDVDSGERCELLRAGADANRDGLLAREERAALEKKVASLVTRPLKLAISGYPIPLTVKDTKLNLRDDQRVSRTAISVALLLEVKHPYEVAPGMHLELETVTPDASPLRLEVYQATQPGTPAEPDFKDEVESGRKVRVRLGALAGPDAGRR